MWGEANGGHISWHHPSLIIALACFYLYIQQTDMGLIL
nr:MAG TPA: hypothetical protein [Caudoviricetes sp.]